MANVDDLVIRAQLKDEVSGPATKVRGSIKGVKKETDKLGDSAKKTSNQSDGMTRSFDRVFKQSGSWRAFGGGAARALGVVGAAFSAAAGAAVAMGVKTASSMQQAKIAFTTLLGSGRKAEAFLTRLKKFAATTPFELSGLVDNSQKLLAMGFSSKEILPTLTAVGDAVAGLGGDPQKLDRVVTALGQIRAKGKASAEEMMQITEAGIPGWDFLAKKMGVDIPTAMQRVTDGAVDAQTTIDALTEGMTKKFGGLMAKQSKTLAGQWSNLKDAASQGLGDLIEESGILDGLTKLITSINEKAVPAVRAFFKDMKKGEGTAGKIGDVLDKTGDVLGKVFGWMLDHKAEVAAFAGTIALVSGAIAILNLVMAANPITLVVLAVAALAAWLVHLYKSNETFREGVQKVWGVVKPFAEFLMKVVVGAIKKLAPIVLESMAIQVQAWKSLLTAVMWVFDKILWAAEKGLGWIPGMGDKIRTARAGFDQFGQGVTQMLDGVSEGLRDAAENVRNLDGKSATVHINYKQQVTGQEAVEAMLMGPMRQASPPPEVKTSGIIPNPLGDTHTRRGGHGGGGWRLGHTLNAHAGVSAALGGGYSVSNALVGGGGHGHGSGDHQKGRAVDVVGRNLPAYAREVRRRGGYAAIHGKGREKHVHAVMGDTSTPRRGSVSGSGGGVHVTVDGPLVQVNNPSSDVDVEHAVERALDRIQREAEELED